MAPRNEVLFLCPFSIYHLFVQHLSASISFYHLLSEHASKSPSLSSIYLYLCTGFEL